MYSFATPDLAQAWNDRKLELKIARRQLYADTLSRRIYATCHRSYSVLRASLRSQIAQAESPADLSIPIFTYDYRWRARVANDRNDMSYYAIVKNTDLCEQVAVLFGREHFWVTWRKSSETEYVLVLHYYPDGLPEAKRYALDACTARREERPVCRPDVEWTVTTTPPHTPPRPSMPPPPPPELLRYKRGLVRDYDSMSDAARDLGSDLMREAECWCYESE
jgi:hypothetical protein